MEVVNRFEGGVERIKKRNLDDVKMGEMLVVAWGIKKKNLDEVFKMGEMLVVAWGTHLGTKYGPIT
ncbi:hypothetical protein SESBI_05109 [Sesbania bispinosa]|nr:hypothetical protein SESBI_05109 [Sesbania bispinosa]